MANMEKTAELLRTVMLDPTRVAIWFEILREPKITAKELMEVINIKKTAMYYHLNLLEKEEIIKGEIVKKQKHYEAVMNFFNLYKAAKEFLKDKKRDLDIFSLLIANSFIQREINRLKNITQEEYNSKKYPIPYSGLWFTNREKIDQVKDEHTQFWEKIIEIDKDEGPDTIANTKFAYYWGVLDFE
jgi:DNA-binding MarR family transcriptional regulator